MEDNVMEIIKIIVLVVGAGVILTWGLFGLALLAEKAMNAVVRVSGLASDMVQFFRWRKEFFEWYEEEKS